jgi:hypothetical protein
LQRPFRNARAVISDSQYRFRFAGADLLQGHIYGRGRRRMSSRIFGWPRKIRLR